MRTFGNIIPEVSFASDECPNPKLWSCYDSEATEIEVLEFLSALIRMTKPSVVVETGTYHGFGTAHLATAVRANGFGHVYSAEVDRECVFKARKLVADYDLGKYVSIMQMSGVDMISSLPVDVDFAFLDSDFKGVRVAELRTLLPKLSKAAIVAIHDTSTYHIQNKGPRLEVFKAVEDLNLQMVQFDTPRGLTLLRRK